MVKIGRNDTCPCQSGKKYKHCCAGKITAGQEKPPLPGATAKITLMGTVTAMQDQAEKREASSRELGVFYLYASAVGDAWLFEMTDCDCIQIAQEGQRLVTPIEENPETIEVNWSHKFTVRNKVLELTSYADKSILVLSEAPSREISAAIRRIRKKFSPQQLQQVHIENQEGTSL
jgi:hypothetical protein